MDINAAFPSTYLKAPDLNGQDVELVIEDVRMTELGDEQKAVVHFRGTDRGLVLNKTNANIISGHYGGETDAWVGKPVTLYPAETFYGGRQVPCIRVRIQPAAPTPQQQANDVSDIPF